MSTSTVQLTITFPTQNLIDIDTHWHDLSTNLSTLSASVGTSDTTVTIVAPTGYSTAAPKVGRCIVVDREAMLVTGINGNVLTVIPGTAVAPLSVAAAHASGATVGVLTYVSPQPTATASAERARRFTSGTARLGCS